MTNTVMSDKFPWISHVKCVVSALAVAAIPMGARAEGRAWDLLKDKQFLKAYHATLGAKQSEKWIAKLFGPSEVNTRKMVGQVEYVLADSCKPHYCETDNLVIAYAPATRAVFVKLVQQGSVIWLGSPSPEEKAQLEDQYVRRFRP